MPQITKDECVPKIKNCAECPLSEQPGCLSYQIPLNDKGEIIGPAKYYCDDCYEGFYWDEELDICNICQIDHCRDCAGEDVCVECTADFMVSPDERGC